MIWPSKKSKNNTSHPCQPEGFNDITPDTMFEADRYYMFFYCMVEKGNQSLPPNSLKIKNPTIYYLCQRSGPLKGAMFYSADLDPNQPIDIQTWSAGDAEGWYKEVRYREIDKLKNPEEFI